MKRFVSEIENMRLCTKGQHMVPIEDFHRNNSRPEGLCDWCKICTRNRRREMTGSTPQARFNAPPGTRRCSWCKEYRSLQLFGDTDNQRSGRVYVCDDCRPEYNRDVWYRTQYGLSLIEVESLFHDQKRRCAACGDKLDKISFGSLSHNKSNSRNLMSSL